MTSWIMALPRTDLEHCIRIGCFGKESPGDRISEVAAGDGIACYALEEGKIIALGRVTGSYYVDDSRKFLDEGVFSHRFDFSAELLAEKEVNISTIADQLTSVPEGGNFGLLLKSGFRILTPEDWALLCEKANRIDLVKAVDAKSNGINWWWVNQGRTYAPERQGGYIWAPQKGKDGKEVFHHLNVSRVRKGDAILHYVDGRIVSVSIASESAVSAPKPAELSSELWDREGYMVRVTYFDLAAPVLRDEIPHELRSSLGSEPKSPFTRAGSVNQGYLFSLPDRYVSMLVRQFPQLLPPGVLDTPTEETGKDGDLENFIEMIRKLRVDRENGIPKLYKPAVLLSIVDAVESGQLKENRIDFQWLVPNFVKTLARFGKIGEERQCAAAFFHLQSEPFWSLSLKTPNQPPLRGEPAQIRSHVEYASFVSPYWSVLNRYPQRIKAALLKHWFEGLSDAAEEEMFDYKSSVANLGQVIEHTGFTFEPWQIACYVTALRTKPFLILAGVSGSGKSQLPQLVANATGGVFELIPVRPDWTDSSDVLGYVQLQGRLRPGPLLRLAKEAEHNPSKFYTCIIDEMNLARVEHYFAEVLSRIEENRGSGANSRRLISQALEAEDKHWESVSLSSNLALIGTVNMDESTHGFSRKVLDRAFTIEFSEIDLTSWAQRTESPFVPANWPLSAWVPRATKLSSLTDLSIKERDQVNQVVTTLVDLNKLLNHAQLQLAYRSRDEIALFVLHANDVLDCFVTRSGLKVDPLDLALQMKVLPRIAGGSGQIRRLVLAMLGWSWSDQSQFKDEDDARSLMREWTEQNKPHFLSGARFPRTCARLCLMWDRIQHEGFTSFWL